MMRFVSFILIAALASAAAPTLAGEKTEPWSEYGAKITLDKSTRLGLAKSPATGKEMLVRGVVTEVCKAKGCWMTVKDGKDEVRVEFQDYGFFVPWNADGKNVRMQGVLTEQIQSPEEQAHIAAESKKGAEPTDQPKKVFVFVATGVAIEGGGAIGAKQKARIEGGAREAEEEHEHSSDHPHDWRAPGRELSSQGLALAPRSSPHRAAPSPAETPRATWRG